MESLLLKIFVQIRLLIYFHIELTINNLKLSWLQCLYYWCCFQNEKHFNEWTAHNCKRGSSVTWWCNQMETFSALLAICAGNSPVTGEFHAQRPVTRSFDVFFDLHLHERLSKQSWDWWFETLPSPLWRHSNVMWIHYHIHQCACTHSVKLRPT